jgi:hypothetical protein
MSSQFIQLLEHHPLVRLGRRVTNGS